MARMDGSTGPGRQLSTGDVVTHDGTIYKDGVPIRYQIVQPAPNQWVAMCVVSIVATADTQSTHRMIVGTGANEQTAVDEMRARVASLSSPVIPEPASSPVIPMDGPESTGIT